VGVCKASGTAYSFTSFKKWRTITCGEEEAVEVGPEGEAEEEGKVEVEEEGTGDEGPVIL